MSEGVLTQPEPDEPAIRAALDAIFADAAFRDSPQLRAFLGYVVNETLAGRGREIKGYSIATLALGRPASFDPQIDPIVRVQAGRVRQALAEHYAAHPEAPVTIHLERGTYAPIFRLRPVAHAAVQGDTPQPPQSATLTSGPAIIALPATMPRHQRLRRRLLLGLGASGIAVATTAWFLTRGTRNNGTAGPLRPAESYYPALSVVADPTSQYWEMAQLTTRLRNAVARFDDLVIVSDAGQNEAIPSSPRGNGWRFTLVVHCAPSGSGLIRMSTRLLDDRDRRVLWAREFEPFPQGSEGDALRTTIIRSAASVVAQPYGVIHAHVRKLIEQRGRTDDPFSCVVKGLDYWLLNTRESHYAARTCIMDQLKLYPSFGPLHAQLVYLNLEEFRQEYNPLPGDPIARAVESARKAVSDRPASARSHQSLMAAYFASGNLEGAWRAGADALALNPHDAEVIADLGSYRVMAGDFAKGLDLIDQAIALNPAPPGWVLTFRAMALYMLGRLDAAGPMVKMLEGSNYALAQIALVMAAYQLRQVEDGRRHLDSFRQIHPAVARNPAEFLRRMNINGVTAARILKDFDTAVSWINEQK